MKRRPGSCTLTAKRASSLYPDYREGQVPEHFLMRRPSSCTLSTEKPSSCALTAEKARFLNPA